MDVFERQNFSGVVNDHEGQVAMCQEQGCFQLRVIQPVGLPDSALDQVSVHCAFEIPLRNTDQDLCGHGLRYFRKHPFDPKGKFEKCVTRRSECLYQPAAVDSLLFREGFLQLN